MCMTRKEVKGSIITDHLTENAIANYKSLRFDFPNDNIMVLSEDTKDEEPDDKWKMYFDMAVNLSRNGIEVVTISYKGK